VLAVGFSEFRGLRYAIRPRPALAVFPSLVESSVPHGAADITEPLALPDLLSRQFTSAFTTGQHRNHGFARLHTNGGRDPQLKQRVYAQDKRSTGAHREQRPIPDHQGLCH
jgi:hypothetical protein